jgi:hypothetical protein
MFLVFVGRTRIPYSIVVLLKSLAWGMLHRQKMTYANNHRRHPLPSYVSLSKFTSRLTGSVMYCTICSS